MRRLFIFTTALAALVCLPGLASAQTAGACTFDGSASIPAGLGAAPKQNVAFTFRGELADAGGGACGFPGLVNAVGEMVAGACGGNVHMGEATTPVGDVTFQGVCAGAMCDGVSVADAGGFAYVLVFDQATIMNAVEQCPNDAFKNAVFTGAAVGGSM